MIRADWRTVAAALSLALALALPARSAAGRNPRTPLDYSDYASALNKHVDGRGMVNYRGLKALPAELDRFLARIGELDAKTYSAWSANDRIAFWINAYNACTLKLIVDHYPLRKRRSLRFPRNSIRQVHGAWDKLTWRVMGRRMTLDEMEHLTLRKQFDEPRIHLALVCAAMGCPRLLNEPYEGDKLEDQFRRQARDFLGNPLKFRIARQKGVVYLSPIFKWFGGDFVGKFGGAKIGDHGRPESAVLNFIKDRVNARDRRFIAQGKFKVKYLKYDWTLNEQKPPPASRRNARDED